MNDERFPGFAWDYAAIKQLTPEDYKAMFPRQPRKNRSRRKRRLGLSPKTRYQIISEHPYCTLCGSPADGTVRLEVDHMNGDPSDNRRENLQVLCQVCNTGKGETPWKNVA